MSARDPGLPNLRLTLKPRARLDVRNALLYTRERRGAEQRSRYRARLYEGMHRLLDFPELGEQRDDVFPGCRTLRVDQHIVFYRIAEREIVVSRVLHFRQNAIGQVEP
jgi:toxin ParE1/3/4